MAGKTKKTDKKFDPKKQLLKILRKYRAEVIQRGTSWVYNESVDLKGKRPIEETKKLVTSLISANEEVWKSNNRIPLKKFIKYVAEYRGKMGFHISTPLKGFLTLKKGIEPILKKELRGRKDRMKYLEIIALIDDLYVESIFELADLYQEIVEERLKRGEEDLKEKVEELEKFNRLAIGRELKIVELKEEIERLKEELEKNKGRST